MPSREYQQAQFYEPILTAAGVVASLIASLSPIFSVNPIKKLFINDNLVTPSSLTAFLLSLAAIWIGSNFPHLNISIKISKGILDKFVGRIMGIWDKKKKRNKSKDEYRNIYLDNKYISWILIFIDITFFYFFVDLGLQRNLKYTTVQAVLYILFFVLISYLFSILFTYTKQMFEYTEKKKALPKKVQELLENYGLIQAGVVLENNIQLNFQELQQRGIKQFSGRYIKVQTQPQPKKELELIINDEATEVFEVIKPNPKNKLEK